jgi:hypothetical protein
MRIVIERLVLFALLLTLGLLSFNTVALSAEIVFEDEFEDLNKWGPSGNIEVDDGVLKVRASAAEGVEWSGTDTRDLFDDFACYFGLKLVDLTGEGDSSFTFRKTGDTGYYMMFGSYGDGVIDLEHLTTWQQIGACRVDIPLASDDEFRVRVVAEADHIIIQVKDAEGNLVVDWDIDDGTYKSGVLHFDSWKFGELDVTNFVVGTPDYLPEEWGGAVKQVEPLGKLSTAWGGIKT